MSETTKVRIGMMSTRELELEMDGSADIAKAFATASEKGEPVLWLTDTRGHRHGIVVDKVAFIEVERSQKREVGFAGER